MASRGSSRVVEAACDPQPRRVVAGSSSRSEQLEKGLILLGQPFRVNADERNR